MFQSVVLVLFALVAVVICAYNAVNSKARSFFDRLPSIALLGLGCFLLYMFVPQVTARIFYDPVVESVTIEQISTPMRGIMSLKLKGYLDPVWVFEGKTIKTDGTTEVTLYKNASGEPVACDL